ncbi:protein of unknown function [endosymbiont DhMRE of Dentiscutata heterogama]|uniref:hypothetical protein n=1 Tax=endosymbiont DhMRE of Dentiscutata heterogama TaxID=1609546 RepID=UPI000629DBC7|nr:hypothetical protein [endosymbiont DhMRE of Dentiscutata heterogama]CFW92876.1 protein of unknown function [endosymbiont DhMRE of Dentiscutata heterogama]
MKSPNIQIKEVPNKIFLSELQNRLRENKIKESQLAKILTELVFAQSEQQLAAAYEEWANDPEEQAEIKAWKEVEKDNWDK